MNVPEILLKAADVIEVRGWHQGGYTPPGHSSASATAPVCVRAAINVASGALPNGRSMDDLRLSPSAYEVADAFADWLKAHGLLGRYQSIAEDWNDRPGRTADQVTTALRECAASLTGGAV